MVLVVGVGDDDLVVVMVGVESVVVVVGGKSVVVVAGDVVDEAVGVGVVDEVLFVVIDDVLIVVVVGGESVVVVRDGLVMVVEVVVSGRESDDTAVETFGGYRIGVILSLCVAPPNNVFHVGPLNLLELSMVTILETCVTMLAIHVIMRFITCLLSDDTVCGTLFD